jgi:hypothetical protein
LRLPRERFSEIQAFLRHSFGSPAQEPTATMDGGNWAGMPGRPSELVCSLVTTRSTRRSLSCGRSQPVRF